MAKAAKPIPLAALMEKVQSGAITEKEVKSYFRISSDRSRPFGPTMAINEDTVAVAGVEATARAIGPSLGYEASKVAQTNKLVAAGAPAPDGSIIAEGNSWFNLPSLYPRTMVDFMQETLPIINLAQWGDELEEMMLTGEYIRYLERGNVKYFLFSGGGNDVLGGGTLTAFLKLYNSLYNGPEYASYYVKKAFYDNLDVVEGLYRKLIENVRRISPKTILVIHGYDYAIPRVNGPWLGEPMAVQGLHPADKKEICVAIIKLMLDQFDNRLARIASEFPNVRHVRMLGVVKANEWFDELHAKEAATKRMATKLAAALK